MFDDLDQARAALSPHFDAARLVAVLGALVPAIAFAPIEAGEDGIGGTRIGGTPDLPPGLTWPRPPAPEDPAAVASRGSAAARADMLRHLALGLPYAFMAQIDLAEAAALGGAAAELPPDGRLLFFYDLATGPWDTGTRVARVVWDRAPREDLRSAEPPPDLLAAAERERADTGQALGRASTDVAGTIYGASARAMRLGRILRLPHPGTMELDVLPDLAASYLAPRLEGADPFHDAYSDALEEFDSLDTEPEHRLQLLGTPVPEQDDPRPRAVRATSYGRQHLGREEWLERRDAVYAESRGWRLLLQLPIGAWDTRDYAEGTVYFVIPSADLAARRFDRVVAVYQQT